MISRHGITLGRAALRAIGYILAGSIRFPQAQLGNVLEFADGETFVLYRETMLQPTAEADTNGVVLLFRLDVANPVAGTILRTLLFDPLANLATPFFAGLPGFRRKLWLAGEQRGEFLELYEWASEADAQRFVGVLRWLLAPFSFLASPSFEVVRNDTVNEYVADRAVEWRWEEARAKRLRRRSRVCSTLLMTVLGIIGRALLRAPRRRASARE